MNATELRAYLEPVAYNPHGDSPVFIEFNKRKYPIRTVVVRVRGPRTRRPRDTQVVIIADTRRP